MNTQHRQVEQQNKEQKDNCKYILMRRLNNIDRFVNQTAALQLQSDLQNNEYNMMEIDVITVNQIFSLFQIKDPDCDGNKDDKISGSQLKCLNKIWKYYVPNDL